MVSIKNISKSIEEIFRQEYIIPNFQRPYTWRQEQCEDLWDDIVNFWEGFREEVDDNKEAEDEYFLGTIILYKDEDNKNTLKDKDAFHVVDGQQRLITLSLLLKALNEATEDADLKASLARTYHLSDKDKPRIESEVIEQNNDELKEILVSGGKGVSAKSRFQKNYKALQDKINSWREDEGKDSKEFNELIGALLDRVKILPIECDSQDYALTIFKTLNDRGLSLNDADILKIEIYNKYSTSERVDFIKRWNHLDDHIWLFRVYMHLLQAKRKKDFTYRETRSLRGFFLEKKRNILGDRDKVAGVMCALERLHYININKWEISSSISIWWKVLQVLGSQSFPEFPLYVFLFKNFDEVFDEKSSQVKIKEGSKIFNEFEELIKWTVRYFYIKGANNNLKNEVKNTTHKIYKNIYQNNYEDKNYREKYQKEYQESLSKDDRKYFDSFKQSIEGGEPFRRSARTGMVLIGGALNKKQDDQKFCEFLDGKYDIEHIYPKEDAHYKESNKGPYQKDSKEKYINLFGNLVPCERNINRACLNRKFEYKKKKYKKLKDGSQVQDLLELADRESIEWSFKDIVERNEKIKSRLLGFFSEGLSER